MNERRACTRRQHVHRDFGARQAERVVKYGQEYLDLFPNGKARTLVSNCMNKAKADLPAQK